jgi:hypothetical protein
MLLASLLVPAALALAAEEKKAAPPDDPMAGWVPRKVTNEAKDKKEIMALLQKMEAAGMKGDLDAALALVDFPVLMATDDSKGEAMGEAWSREQWIQVMRPFYDKPMKGMKVTHKPTIFLLSDSLASVDDVVTMTMGKKTVTMRNTSLLIRRNGEWLLKVMAEPGWGDMMAAAPQGAGSGAATQHPASPGAAGGSGPPASPGMGGGAPAPGERTTK